MALSLQAVLTLNGRGCLKVPPRRGSTLTLSEERAAIPDALGPGCYRLALRPEQIVASRVVSTEALI